MAATLIGESVHCIVILSVSNTTLTITKRIDLSDKGGFDCIIDTLFSVLEDDTLEIAQLEDLKVLAKQSTGHVAFTVEIREIEL
jgi:hypothetical protein